jgi:hypothetical protein
VAAFRLVHGPIVAANGIAAILLDVRRLTYLAAEEDSADFAPRRDL